MVRPREAVVIAVGRRVILCDRPGVHVTLPRIHVIVIFLSPGCIVFVPSTLSQFVVKHAMGVHGVGSTGIILEDNFDGVANLTSNDWPQKAEVVWLVLFVLKRFVLKFPI